MEFLSASRGILIITFRPHREQLRCNSIVYSTIGTLAGIKLWR